MALTPGFDPVMTSYEASVANDVSRITVTPKTSNPSATVEYFDASDAEISDADMVTTGHQIDVDVGKNTIKVEGHRNGRKHERDLHGGGGPGRARRAQRLSFL